MIGAAIDHVVSWFAPAAAARRKHARNVYSRFASRGYDAGSRDRLSANWLPSNQSPDLALSTDAATIRARARDLVRNNPYARGILFALVRNVVGCGIFPQANTGDEQLDESVEELFSRWARVADVSGRLTWWEIQRLAFQEVLEAGECLIHFTSVDDDRSRPLRFAVELIDADRIADDRYSAMKIASPNGNEIRRGVEIDAFGRPVAYWLYPRHPNDVNGLWTQAERFPADQFVHLFKCERIGQTRGVSMFAPVIQALKSLHYYTENELQASAVASCFTAAIKTMGGPADGGLLDTVDSDSSDTDGNQFEYLQPGMVARLLPGEEVEVINPSRPNNDASAWLTFLLRALATGVGLSYERMCRDYTQTNYSSARSSDLEDRREFRVQQDWVCSHMCDPVYLRFLEAAVDEAKIPATASELLSDYDTVTKHHWQKPGWEWVDPVKEFTASDQAVQANLSTLQDELGARGKDLRTVLEQRAKEKRLMREMGITEEMEDEGETDGETQGQVAAGQSE